MHEHNRGPLEQFSDLNPLTQALPEEIKKKVPKAEFKKVEPVTRRCWSGLSDSEKDQVIDAISTAFNSPELSDTKDPRSWTGQAWIHNYFCMSNPILGCIHGNWNFLAWHRAFLYFHEKIIRKFSKNESFRLPAWDWESKRADCFPPKYAALRLKLNTAVERLIPGLKNHTGPADFLDCSLSKLNPEINKCRVDAWLCSDTREEFIGGAQKAGNAAGNGQLHETVHEQGSGIMGDYRTAALHPVFYAHHANVDRYWERWCLRYPGFAGADGWGETMFYFYEPSGQLVKIQAEAVLHTRNLGYDYEPPRSPGLEWAGPVPLKVDQRHPSVFRFAGEEWDRLAILIKRSEELDKTSGSDPLLNQAPVLQLLFRHPEPSLTAPTGYFVTMNSIDEGGHTRSSVSGGFFGSVPTDPRMCVGMSTAASTGLCLGLPTRTDLFPAGVENAHQYPIRVTYREARPGMDARADQDDRPMIIENARVFYPQSLDSLQ
jgi:hypothetical protein